MQPKKVYKNLTASRFSLGT